MNKKEIAGKEKEKCESDIVSLVVWKATLSMVEMENIQLPRPEGRGN